MRTPAAHDRVWLRAGEAAEARVLAGMSVDREKICWRLRAAPC